MATTRAISGSRWSRAAASCCSIPGEFYILASKEAVEIPVLQAAEMIPIDPAVGEFRVHYAGFFDPGFGTAETDSLGARAACWRCAAARPRSCWKTARPSRAWSSSP